MSVEFPPTSGSYASDHGDVPDDPRMIFPDLVADASLCCQQCFRRLGARRRFPDEPGRAYGDLVTYVDATLPEDADWELLDAEYWETERERERTTEAAPPSDGPTGTTSACGFCGAVDTHRSPATRSRDAALEAAAGISATLTELAVAHNPLVLLVEVSDLKQTPETAGDDFETFRTAVDRAVRAARG